MMTMKKHLSPVLASCLILLSISPGKVVGNAVPIIIRNECPFPIWPATAPNKGHPVIADGGFYVGCNQRSHVNAPWDWSGRIWARTRCNFPTANSINNTYKPGCQTGDCDGHLACKGISGTPPATLVEITFQPFGSSYYDVSLVDGYNLPVSVNPRPFVSECAIRGCLRDIKAECPPELRVLDKNDGKVVACKSACLAFNNDYFCCRNRFGSLDKCKPSVYSRWFKGACPGYFSYAFDRPSPLINCAAVQELVITFCPSRWGIEDAGMRADMPS